MPDRVRALKSIRLDVVQAIRRASMHRGILLGKDSPAPRNRPPEPKTKGPTPTELTGAQEPQEVHERLIDITEKAQDVLFKADTVFPFTVFPDTISLDREKLTVVTRTFFKVAKIINVPVSSISSAEVDVGPFFGSLHMASKYFVQNTYSVNFLTRADALNLQHMLQGFIIAQQKKVDLTDIEKNDLLVLLKDLGQGVSE